MTERKHFKQLVRARMKRTGESYTTARRHVLRETTPPPAASTCFHFPGSTPGPTALRALLASAGVVAPHTKTPFSEAMVFGIAGGIGAGMFTFHYAKENFSSFFVAGRHQWHDTYAWTTAAARRFGATPVVKEASGAKPAEKNLRELLATGRPAMVWLTFRGRQYHVATVHGVDDAAGVALVGDLGDSLVRVPLAELSDARAQTKKDKNRALALEPAGRTPPLEQLVTAGIAACVTSLTTAKQKNFRLDAFKTWADRLAGSSAPDSWERIFPRGRLLYTGLRSVAEYIEHYDTGGGLSRPLFAEFLAESADALGDRSLRALSERYAAIGTDWTALANAALPADVPLFAQVKQLLENRSEALSVAEATTDSQVSLCAKAMADAEAAVADGFPLSEAECAALRRDLKSRVQAVYEAEVAALGELQRYAAAHT